jgi:hypothetical protein
VDDDPGLELALAGLLSEASIKAPENMTIIPTRDRCRTERHRTTERQSREDVNTTAKLGTTIESTQLRVADHLGVDQIAGERHLSVIRPELDDQRHGAGQSGPSHGDLEHQECVWESPFGLQHHHLLLLCPSYGEGVTPNFQGESYGFTG